MTEIIKKNDIVKVSESGKIGIVSAIQYENNRYQLKAVSNWQYGIEELSKLEISSLITTIESQKAEIESQKNFFKGYDHQNRLIESRLEKQIESLQNENEQLREHRDTAIQSAARYSRIANEVSQQGLPKASDATESPSETAAV